MIVIAAAHIVLVAGSNILSIRVAGALSGWNLQSFERDSAAVSVWLAPVAVYLAAGSLYAIPMAAVFAAQAAWMFRAFRQPTEHDVVVYSPELFHIFHVGERRPLSKPLSLFLAAGCIEFSVAGVGAKAFGLSALFAATGFGIVSWHVGTAGTMRRGQNDWQRFISSGLTMLLALSLTASGLSRGFGMGNGDGEGNSARLDGGHGGKYWGVFLVTDVPSSPPQLVGPVRRDEALLSKGIRIPVKIRFDGVYWFFRPPDVEPPGDATVLHGAPDETGFLSTDSTPLLP